jgi:cytochrome b
MISAPRNRQALQAEDVVNHSTVRVWDLPTRLSKWLLVACVVTAWAINTYAPGHPEWHKWNGYTVLVLVAFRVLWGCFGSPTARFSDFVTWPWTAAAYGWAEFRGQARHYLGHNPLGGWMILALLAAVAMQAILGLYSADDERVVIEGPLAHTVSEGTVDWATHLHRLGFNIILGLVIIHVIANVAHDMLRHAGLIRGMITGRKSRFTYVNALDVTLRSPWTAVGCLAVAILIVAGGITILSRGWPT